MTNVAQQKDMPLLSRLAETLAALNPDRIALVAIDGVDGVGKTVFADNLAAALADCGRKIIRASVDGFHNPRAVRYARGRSSAEGFYYDSYNYEDFRTQLLEPLNPGGSRRFRRAVFDYKNDVTLAPHEETASEDSIVILDGIFLHRSELRAYWDFSIFLDAPFEVTVPRMAVRDGLSPDPLSPSHRRYVEGQKIYLEQVQPRQFATLVIDNTDFNNPKILSPEEDAARRVGT